jgi:hypothetical protein
VGDAARRVNRAVGWLLAGRRTSRMEERCDAVLRKTIRSLMEFD